MFYRKLDRIMKVTRTTNSDLSRKLPLSSSYICRLRSGKRKLPNVPSFLPNMVDYFIKKMKEEDWENLGFKTIPEFKEKELSRWFLEKELTFFKENPVGSRKSFDCHFGEEGKRLLVLQFLGDVLKCEKKQTLLLYSNENISWLISDPLFLDEWQKFLIKILKKGNSIKIVHNFNRNFHEMFRSLEKWIPIYMTGKIKPYLCNYLRDGIFEQSFFIAPESGAIVSSSVKGDTDKMPNFYFHSNQVINSFISEFNNFLKLTTPFLDCYQEQNELIEDFFLDENPIHTSHPGFSLATLPEELLKGMDANYIKFWKYAVRKFDNALKKEKVIEFCQLYSKEEIKKGVLLPFSGLLGFPKYYYTVDSYLLHLENVVKLSSEKENYDLEINYKKDCYQSYLIKQDKEILICDNTISPFLFHVKRPELISAIWYLLNKNVQISQEMTRAEITEKLKTHSQSFEI